MNQDMAGFNPAYPSLWEKAALDHVEQDRICVQGSGYLLACDLTASGGNATATIHDGVNNNGRVLMPVAALQNYSAHFCCRYPRRFEQGLFVDLSANVGNCVVMYVTDKALQTK